MNPTASDKELFQGIPRQKNRGPRNFLSSLCVHIAAILLSAALAPQMVLRGPSSRESSTTLIAPPEPQPEVKALPKPVPEKAPVAVVSPPPNPLKEFRAPVERQQRLMTPKLEEAPALPSFPRQDPALPTPIQPAEIRPAVQTGVFGVNAPTQNEPKLPAPAATAAGGFDAEQAVSRPASTASTVRTGSFGATEGAHSNRVTAANVAHTGFDFRPANEKQAQDGAVRRSSFEEAKTAAPAVKPTAPIPAAVRPVEILDKPKPAYTVDARKQRIEGTVVLDVIFTATGEVKVLGVSQGLGHGLDENAIDAARRIRFRPATQAGAPVDQRALLHVVFEITG
jgi:TonB family protein